MILIGLGANLPSRFGPPVATLEQALVRIGEGGERIVHRSQWYETAPVPISDQPWYVNGVAAIDSERSPAELLHRLHAIETRFGRVRAEPNAARAIDLDLLDYRGQVSRDWPVLPHPRMTGRRFVLMPLQEILPDWRDPVDGTSIAELLAEVDPAQVTRVLNATR